MNVCECFGALLSVRTFSETLAGSGIWLAPNLAAQLVADDSGLHQWPGISGR